MKLSEVKKGINYLFHGKGFLIAARLHRFYPNMPDEEYIRKQYKAKRGKELDLEHPRTFNEKLQWIKLYDRKPEYTVMADKYEAKGYIADRVGEQYVIPTIGVWDKFDDIDFSALPERFVLKCTHDCGGMIICKNKTDIDHKSARRKFNAWLKKNYYYYEREWSYKNIKPRIIAEQYLDFSTADESSAEYKILCFNGKAKVIRVCKGEAHTDRWTVDYYDMELNRLPFHSADSNSADAPAVLHRSRQLDEMIKIAEKLSENTICLRVDFYCINGKVFVGELTFYDDGGYVAFTPEEWDEKFGEYLELPIE